MYAFHLDCMYCIFQYFKILSIYIFRVCIIRQLLICKIYRSLYACLPLMQFYVHPHPHKSPTPTHIPYTHTNPYTYTPWVELGVFIVWQPSESFAMVFGISITGSYLGSGNGLTAGHHKVLIIRYLHESYPMRDYMGCLGHMVMGEGFIGQMLIGWGHNRCREKCQHTRYISGVHIYCICAIIIKVLFM